MADHEQVVAAPDHLDAGRNIGPELDPRATAGSFHQPAQGRPVRQRAQVERLAPAAVGYAVAEVLTDALAAAGSTNPAKLNTAIAHTDARTTAGLVTFNQLTHTAITAYHVTR